MGKIQIVLDDETENKFRVALAKAQEDFKRGNMSDEIRKLILQNIDKISMKFPIYKQKEIKEIDFKTTSEIEKFYDEIDTIEKETEKGLLILFDKKSNAYYTECHIRASEIFRKVDIDAVVDPDNPDFRLNRELNKTHPAFKDMISDAKQGRQFSDIIIDFNPYYPPKDKPLKVLGGQHRATAIKEAFEKDKVNLVHGLRVYFNLANVEQRREVAEIANTNINISLDLRDRLWEQQLTPSGRLREWAWEIGILEKGKDFADKRRMEEDLPTVRMLRTFIVDFYEGKNYKGDVKKDVPVPYLCQTGGLDKKYEEIFNKLKSKPFKDYHDLHKAGKEFVKLHKKQVKNAKKQYKNKALALAVISSWAFTAGVLQKDEKSLKKLYSIPELAKDSEDPLNGDAMAEARAKTDSPTYRGLGTRYDDKERGRLLQFFYRLSTSDYNEVSLELYNLAIRRYHHQKEEKEINKNKPDF